MQQKAFRVISLLLHQHLTVILPSQTGTVTLLPYFVRNKQLTWQKSFLMSIHKLLLCVNSLNCCHCNTLNPISTNNIQTYLTELGAIIPA